MWECVLVCRTFTLTKKGTILRVFFAAIFGGVWMARRTIIRIGKMAAKNERPEQANPVTDLNANRSCIFLNWYTVDTSELWQLHVSWDLSGRRISYQPELARTFLKNQQQAFDKPYRKCHWSMKGFSWIWMQHVEVLTTWTTIHQWNNDHTGQVNCTASI